MKQSFVRFVCRLLVLCVALLPLQAQSGMIGTGQAVSAEQGQAARDALRSVIDRAESVATLQSYGISPQEARARIAALTDAEAALLADHAAQTPAGANGIGVGLLIIIVFLIWHFIVGPSMNPETKKEDKKK